MMAKVFYQLLGMAAWANERLSRQSVNFIPANWIILVSIGAFLLIGVPEIANAWLYGIPTSMNFEAMVCTMAFLTIVLLFFLATFCSQYIVFQKTAPNILEGVSLSPLTNASPFPITTNPEAKNVSALNVTGRFILDEKNAQRFLNVPASMKVVENGDIAFFSGINASVTMYETLMLKERVGIWYLMMKRDSLRSIEPGLLYFGKDAQHSLKIHHTDAITSKSVTTIVGFSKPGGAPGICQSASSIFYFLTCPT